MSGEASSIDSRIASFIWSARAPAKLSEIANLVETTETVAAATLRRMAARQRDAGFVLVETAGGWAYRSNPEFSDHLPVDPATRLSDASLEILVIVAAFGPVTRSEIERFRQTSVAPVTMSGLLERNLIRPGRRRNTPGRPLTWMVHDRFFELFDIADLERDLPGFAELRGLRDVSIPGISEEAGQEEETLVDEDDGQDFDHRD